MAQVKLLRIVAGTGLVATLALPSTALAAGKGHGHNGDDGKHDGHKPKQTHYVPGVRPHYVAGTLESVSGTTPPAVLTLKTAGGIMVTVDVSPTTTIVRRYNGPSTLGELTVGDRVEARGVFAPGQTATFNAQRVTDITIQDAYTHVVGIVKTPTSAGVTLAIYGRRDHRARHNPYDGGPLNVTFTSSTTVISGTATVPTSAVQAGMRISAVGTYDRQTEILTARQVHILNHGRVFTVPAAPSAS